MNVDDVYLILYHHWIMDTATFPGGLQRLQVALLVLITAYTATWPGASVHVGRNEKRIKGYYLSGSDEEEDTTQNGGNRDCD